MASYSKDQNNKWHVRFRAYEDGKIKNKRLSGYERKKDAEEAYRTFMANYTPPPKSTSEMSFNQLWLLYKAHITNRLKESSVIDICSAVQNHILPDFGGRQLSEITKKDVLIWQNTLNDKGYSYKSKTTNRTFFSANFKFGQRYYDILDNPVTKVESFRNLEGKKEMSFWSFEEFRKFISCVDNSLWHAFFSFLYFSGVRKGEALALAWADLDTKRQTISINKSKTKKTNTGAAYLITSPKNKSSYRVISIPETLCNELLSLKYDDRRPSDFIFGGDKPLAEQTITNNLKKYCALSGVKIIRVHDFRHSHVSYLISKGVSIVAIAKRLGHSDIEQTYNTYSHMLPEDETKIMLALDMEY
jgi:integrase